MAWVDVSGSNGVWQYENAATAANTYPDSADGANSTVSGGIRTHTRPGTNAVTKTYLRVRKTGQINLFHYSEEFNQGGLWNPMNSAISADTTTAPNGTITADKLTQSSGQTNGDLSNLRKLSVPSTSGTNYIISIHAKISENRNYLMINDHISSAQFRKTWFNLSNGTVGTTNSTHTAKIKDEGNGWYRCSISVAGTVTKSNGLLLFAPTETDNSATVTDNQGSLFIWGAQMNEGTIFTPYIKTANAASTTIERGEVSKTFFDAQ
jgi:hypothetical protein